MGTQLNIADKQLILTCTGDDPGLSFDRLPQVNAPGPYTLEFRLQSTATGPGEIYWTTDAQTKLPKGRHLDFVVTHDGQWHTHQLAVDETKTIRGLRLDPCAGPGKVVLEGLALKSATGAVLRQWP